MSLFLPPLIGSARNVKVQFDVLTANERWERRRGARVPWNVYRGDRRWTPPLRAQWMRALDPNRNPMLAGVEHAVFLAEARNLSLGDVVVARLVVWAGHADGIGYFGAFETINDPDLAQALFSAAETWFFEHVPGLEEVRGPVSPDPLCASGLLVDGFAARPAAFLPYSPPYYPELLWCEEFELHGAWQAYALDLCTAAGTQAEGRPAWEVRVVGAREWPDLASQLLDLCRQAEDSLGAWQAVLPLLAGEETDPRFSLEARLAIRYLRPRALVAVAWEAGEPIGAVVGVPDNSSALRRANGRLLPWGWLPYLRAMRRTRQLRIFPAVVAQGYPAHDIEPVLYAALAQAAVARGFDTAIVGPLAGVEQGRGSDIAPSLWPGVTAGPGSQAGEREPTTRLGQIARAQAMATLGAHVVQTYQMCEKRY